MCILYFSCIYWYLSKETSILIYTLEQSRKQTQAAKYTLVLNQMYFMHQGADMCQKLNRSILSHLIVGRMQRLTVIGHVMYAVVKIKHVSQRFIFFLKMLIRNIKYLLNSDSD
jgi:hypothetical protein